MLVLAPPTNSLIKVTSFTHAADTDVSSSSTALADVDATNLAVTFTVPASGKVLVRLTGHCYTSAGYAQWGLRESSSDITAAIDATQSTGGQVVSMSFLISGLTPGATKTYKWAHARTSGTGHFRYGPAYGPGVMEVYAVA